MRLSLALFWFRPQFSRGRKKTTRIDLISGQNALLMNAFMQQPTIPCYVYGDKMKN